MNRCLSLSLVVLSLFSLTYTSFLYADDDHLIKRSVNVAKGNIDQRDYHYFALDNQLRVLLISDATADKAAASLDVHVGSSDDPKGREGLAHFLEHMLFLGTKKYPDAAEYQAFISANGGGHNAYTSAEHTNYFFDIDANQLEPALDRFSQFFVAPLFDAVYVDRERNAVHSEYQARIKDDSRRGYDVYRQFLNPEHPYAKFSVGSLTTLADRDAKDEHGNHAYVRDDLLDFYQKHYSSEQMTLVVLGKESIAQLKAMVEQRFSDIPRREVVENHAHVPLFAKGLLPVEVLSQPVKDIRQMNMVFPLPSIKPYYGEKPLNYIGFLLGHEGKGSLLSVLKAQGWAEGLSAGGNESGAANASFHIAINLTEEGIKQRETIRALVFHAIDTIKKSGVELWRYNEEKQLAEISFKFREKSRAISTVSQLSNNLHDYPPAEVISGDYLYQKFDADLIQLLLSKMNPQNLYVNTVFPEANTDKITHYYRVPYAAVPLTSPLAELNESLKKQYTLPEKNIFVPNNSELLKADQKLTELVKLPTTKGNKKEHELWAKQDTSFNVPKANISLRIQSPKISHSLESAAHNHLLMAMIQDRLNENSYPASIAGLHYSLRANGRGLDISLQGYNDKMGVLLEMITRELAKPKLNQERFTNVKKELLRNLRNTKKQSPYRQLIGQLPDILLKPYWSDMQLADVIETARFKDVKRAAKSWRKGALLQGLFYGNIDSHSAQQWEQAITPLLKRGKQLVAPLKVANLSKGVVQDKVKEASFSVDHNDKTVGLYVQGVNDSLESQAKMVLLRQVLDANFYTQLRTEQQLGYIVFLTSMTLKEVPGSLFLVQSPGASIDDIKLAIERFIREAINTLPKDLSVYQQSVNTKLLEKPQTLSVQADRYWQNIIKGDDSFAHRQRLAAAVNQVTSQQLIEYYQDTLLNQQMLLWLVTDKSSNEQPLDLFQGKQAVYEYR